MPTPNELRAEMAATVNKEFIDLARAGQIAPSSVPLPDGTVIGQQLPMPGLQAAAAQLSQTQAPAPQQTQPQPTGQPQGEATPADKRWFAKKYEDEEKAEQGMFNLINYASSLRDELTLAQNRLNQMQNGSTPSAPVQSAMLPGSTPAARERVNPIAAPDWRTHAGVVKAAEEAGVDPSTLGGLAQSIYDVVEQSFDARIEAKLAPMQAMSEAQQYMATTYPDALKHGDKLDMFLNANPAIKENASALWASGKPKAAAEYAWQMYAVASGLEVQNQMHVNNIIAEAERTAARAAAGLPASTPQSPVHAASQDQRATPDELKDLAARGHAGDPAAATLYRRLTIGASLPAELRTWEGQR